MPAYLAENKSTINIVLLHSTSNKEERRYAMHAKHIIDSLPKTRKELHRDIYYNGRDNGLEQINNKIAEHYFGLKKGQKSFVDFIPAKHLGKDADLVQVRICLDAAIMSLQIHYDYYLDHKQSDPLYALYWETYSHWVRTGNDDDIDLLKQIKWFVTTSDEPYGSDEYKTDIYPYCKQLLPYENTDEYPPEYRMHYDIIDEFDIHVTNELRMKHFNKYSEAYLSRYPYDRPENIELTRKLKRTITHWAKKVSKHRRIVKRIQNIIDNGIGADAKQIPHSKCACGYKDVQSYNMWDPNIGVTQEAYEYIDNLLTLIEHVHHFDHIDRPIVSNRENAMTLKDVSMRFMILPDPKKVRYAYGDTLLHYLLAKPAMLVIDLILEGLPWVRTGKKPVDLSDYIDQKDRWEDLKSVYEKSLKYNIGIESTDLTKATEHQNIFVEIEILYQFMREMGIEVDKVWLENSLSFLGTSHVFLALPEEYEFNPRKDWCNLNGKWYPKLGQCQGVPASFHLMTFTLALINWDSAYNAVINHYNWLSEEDREKALIGMLRNNGDDAISLCKARKTFIKYLNMLADPDGKYTGTNVIEELFNEEKSIPFDLVGGGEFCKTFMYYYNQKLITGYRYASLYKVIGSLSAMTYMMSGDFDNLKEVIQQVIPTFDKYRVYWNKYDKSKETLHPVDFTNGFFQMWNARENSYERAQKLLITRLLYNLQMEILTCRQYRYRPSIVTFLPESVYPILKEDPIWVITNPGYMSIYDLSKFTNYYADYEGKYEEHTTCTIEEAFLYDECEKQWYYEHHLHGFILSEHQFKDKLYTVVSGKTIEYITGTKEVSLVICKDKSEVRDLKDIETFIKFERIGQDNTQNEYTIQEVHQQTVRCIEEYYAREAIQG